MSDLPAFLAANNLAPLWQSFAGAEPSPTAKPQVLDGFYGDEHRHIAFLFDYVRQDAKQPTLFRVRGRSRYRRVVTAFEGSFTVRSLQSLRGLSELALDSATQRHATAYTATAYFVLREDSAAAGGGTYRGTALLDFYRLGSGQLLPFQIMEPAIPDKQFPTRGSGTLFRGQWQGRQNQRAQPVAFAPDVRAVLPGALADLFWVSGRKSSTPNTPAGAGMSTGAMRNGGSNRPAQTQPLILADTR